MLVVKIKYFPLFGGFNCIRFNSDFDYSVENLINDKKKLSLLNNSSILIWSGIQRKGQILEKEKIAKIKKKSITQNLKNIQSVTEKAYEEFSKSSWDLEKIGKLMNEYWQQKKHLSRVLQIKRLIKYVALQIRTERMESNYSGLVEVDLSIYFAHPKRKKNLLKKLSKFGNVNFQFENSGSSIIYNKQLI